MSIRTVIAGAAGRMGQSLIRAIAADESFQLTGALASAANPDLGNDAGTLAGIPALGVALACDPLPAVAAAQVLIDFSAPAASVALAALAAQARIVHVMGTTGFSEDDETRIGAAARHAVIVKSGNMSLGVTLLAALAKQAAKALPGFDIEIVEMHHRRKVDAPSGTALLLGEAAAEGRGEPLARRAGPGARDTGSIGFASLRGGTVVGEHEVVFAGPHERIALRHVAEDRSIFASGALAAAKWGLGKKPGLYSMRDVLGL
ncbi:MAG TPA: 4-hydroxy-tetrahydrodipicolinate reductase [Rhizomicrobium sp.]|nr:4-hydroxy-tetrahydrodipicolinate reductase [Rhizomicrobium sp.]